MNGVFSPDLWAGLILGLLIGAAVVWLYLTLRFRLEARKIALEARRDALQKSRSTLKGQIAEHMAPLLPEFPYLTADARFLGDPVDYIVFDGYAHGGEVEIVFVEIKTGRSGLTPGERRIRDAIRAGRVRWELIRLQTPDKT